MEFNTGIHEMEQHIKTTQKITELTVTYETIQKSLELKNASRTYKLIDWNMLNNIRISQN
jgi:hypothetical protein